MGMQRVLACFLWTSALLAQDPLQALVQAYWTAHAAGHFAEAAARRDGARRLLEAIPPEAPELGWQARTVADLYMQGGFSAQARAILERTLGRTSAAYNRSTILEALANNWEQERNLRRAAGDLERAIELPDSPPPVAQPFGIAGTRSFIGPGFAPQAPRLYLYQHLANVYRQLGRRAESEAMEARMLAVASNPDALRASLYEQQNRLDEAAALYRKQAGQAGDVQQQTNALQSLSNVYLRQEHFDDAVAALRQAIQLSPDPPQYLQFSLAHALQRSGKLAEADRVYADLLAQTPDDSDQRISLLSTYANYLGVTRRSEQAETILSEYRAAHPDLPPWQDANLLFQLSSAARMAGDTQRAEEYQIAATEKQPQPQGKPAVSAQMGRAESAARRGETAVAYDMALQGIQAAAGAADREQLPWRIGNVAMELANHNAPDLGDQLHRAALQEMQSWSADTLQALGSGRQNYAHFLVQQRRWSEVPDAIETYRAALLADRGPESGWLEDVLRLEIDAASGNGRPDQALPAAEQLLALAETTNGDRSEPYLRALETLAGHLQSAGQDERALSLYQKAIPITDALAPADYVRQGFARMNAAFLLARRGRFEEAQQLIGQAQSLAGRLRPPQPNLFDAQSRQIRAMQK